MNAPPIALYACFLLSGASALLYQVVWERMLTLVFGLSTVSVAAVLSAFLGGMALGARAFGPLADRAVRPLKVYAIVEISIALAGAATLWIIPAVMPAFATIYAAVNPGWFGSNLIRFGLALLAIGGPSILIGATVPVMARLLADRAGSTAIGFGRGYAVNTAGSVLGALAAGFVLLRFAGAQNALLIAVAGNMLAAAVSAALAREGKAARGPAPAAAPRTPAAPTDPDSSVVRTRFALAAAALTGMLGLGYEVAWIRLLAIFTLNSVYVFAMVVSVYLAALALGAAIATALLRRTRVDALAALSVCQLLQALLAPLVIGLAPLASRLELTSGRQTEAQIIGLEFSLAAAIVFLPALLIGAGLPLLVRLAARSSADPGATVGRLYAWNAVGTIAGAALTGVVIIPWVGLRGCLLLLAGGNLVVVAAAALVARGGSTWPRVLPALGAAAFALALALLPGATRFYVPVDPENETVVYYAEGPSATVHVSEYIDDGKRSRALFVDSKSVAGTYDEIVTDQKMLAHLPLLLHPDPRHALTVGFGTGGTSYSMLLHRVVVDCVEIEPRVPDAAPLFESENLGMVGADHNRHDFRLILDDARAWLHVADRKYDVIVTDLTSIQYRGNGNLYTAECFQLIKNRLNDGGIGAAWVPITGIGPAALKTLIRTFEHVFPHTSVWYAINLPTDFVIVIGTPAPLAVRLDDIATRMAATLIDRDLGHIGMDNPYKLAACLMLAGPSVAAYTAAGVLHRDDRPVLDYMTHATPYQNTLPLNLTQLAAVRPDLTPFIASWPGDAGAAERWRAWRLASEHMVRGHILLRGAHVQEDFDRAEDEYVAALRLVPDDARTKSLLMEMEQP